MKRVLLADDHSMFLQGLKLLLSTHPTLDIVATACNGLEILHLLNIDRDIDLVIMDINMPQLSGYDTALIIHKKYPDVKMIALSMLGDETSIAKMLDAGVQAYLHKNASEEELHNAIELVLQGGYSVPEGMDHLIELHFKTEREVERGYAKREPYPLSKREIEIVKLIVEGNTNTEIADQLFLSHRTVDTHRKNILAKLQLKNTASLVKYVSEQRAFLGI